MSVNTVNSYGKISVTDDAVALIVAHSALDVYGVVNLVTNKFSDSIRELFKKSYKPKGIKVTTISDRIIIDLDIIFPPYKIYYYSRMWAEQAPPLQCKHYIVLHYRIIFFS